MRAIKLDSTKELRYKLLPENKHEKAYLNNFSRHYGFIGHNYIVHNKSYKALALLINAIIKLSQ